MLLLAAFQHRSSTEISLLQHTCENTARVGVIVFQIFISFPFFFGGVGWGLLSDDTFSEMYDHALFLCLQIIRSDIRPPQVTLVGNLEIADGHLNLSQGFVWVCKS